MFTGLQEIFQNCYLKVLQ